MQRTISRWSGERTGGLADAERELYRWILTSFAQGRPPADAVRRRADEVGLDWDETKKRLREGDFVQFDAQGEIAAAYPFSGVPTAHSVEVVGLGHGFAMCAIDALGIPFMLGRPAKIASADPAIGEPVLVEIDPSEPTLAWEPADAVVVYGALPGGTTTATACCPFVNFFASEGSARAYLEAKPGLEGRIRTMPEAIEAGRTAFGDALG